MRWIRRIPCLLLLWGYYVSADWKELYFYPFSHVPAGTRSTSFNQGPILNLDLADMPHDRVRVRLDLYTFGDWRGLQRGTGGPQHRLMFFDGKASPGFSFDTNFATNPDFKQSWPDRNPRRNKATATPSRTRPPRERSRSKSTRRDVTRALTAGRLNWSTRPTRRRCGWRSCAARPPAVANQCRNSASTTFALRCGPPAARPNSIF